MRWLLLIAFVVSVAGAAEFTDPAPPVVRTIAATQLAAPTPFKGLTFHQAPTPLAKDAVTHDWAWFLGPQRCGQSTETRIADELPQPMRAVWEVSRGSGYAAPAILDDRLILFHRVEDQEVVDCLHRETGQRFWRFAYQCEYADRYGYSSGPRCAPVIDARSSLVFTYGVRGQLHALDLASGQVVWKRDLMEEFKLKQNFFGVGAAPLIEGELLIVNVGAKDACVVGFDLRTGKAGWASAAPGNWGPSYASPIPATVHGKRRVFVFAGGESRPATGGLLCINPADGSVDFSFPWRGRRYESVNASSPLIVGSQVFVSECYGAGGVLLDLALEGEKLAAKVAWKSESLGTHFTVALQREGHLYGCDGHGPNDCPMVCLDFKTGKEKWRTEPDLTENLKRSDGQDRPLKLSSSLCHLLQVDGKTLCLTEWGHLLILDLSPEGMKIKSRRWLFAAGETWTPPVLSRGLLYVLQNQNDRLTGTAARLICYDLRK